MAAPLTSPFDVLPGNLFNLLGSQAGELQVHYIAILLRVYEMAEFNRFGLTRELVIAEIIDYLAGDGAGGIGAVADAAREAAQDASDEDDSPNNEVQDYAGWILRRTSRSLGCGSWRAGCGCRRRTGCTRVGGGGDGTSVVCTCLSSVRLVGRLDNSSMYGNATKMTSVARAAHKATVIGRRETRLSTSSDRIGTPAALPASVLTCAHIVFTRAARQCSPVWRRPICTRRSSPQAYPFAHFRRPI